MSDISKIETDEVVREPMGRLRRAAAHLARMGNPLGGYFMALGENSVASQRDTKDHLPQRLRASAEVPQVVTVQGRGGQKGAAYMIIPLDKMVEALETQTQDEPFVPITASLREIGGDVDLPLLSPSHRSGHRLRSRPRSLPGMSQAD
jgi:hypothetical protein